MSESAKLKVLTVFGTRPEAIKMAPVVMELVRRSSQFISRVCVTAQHREMLDQVLDLFGITPDYDLNIMQNNQTPTQVAASVLAGMEPILEQERPDWVLVQGDTTTVAAAAWAAFYGRVRVGHVEAGLRTHNKQLPFPEEVNRRIASVIADLHFAPTASARDNLLREGIIEDRTHVTGNPVIDALHYVANLPYDYDRGVLAGIPLQQRIVLVTAHRRENFGLPIQQICLAIRDLAQAYSGDVHFVYPVHPNPNVQVPVHRILDGVTGVTLMPPLDYLPLVHLMKRATLVLTDSGGLQEEAPALGKPVLVMRYETERPEAVASGGVRLVGPDPSQIIEWTRRLLDNKAEYERMAHVASPYGDGHASQRIVTALYADAKCSQ
jgi:UDP-N-acetylglucosamine 2-epimerase (non-hydrolysing)